MIRFQVPHVKRAVAAGFCSALLSVAPVLAQTDVPPPPPSGQAGPPPGHDGPRRGGPDRRAEMLQRELDLTPDQLMQVKALMETEHTSMETVHSNSSLTPEQMHVQMMAIHEGSEAKLRALLTPEQVGKLDAMQARMREHRQNGAAAPPTAPQP